MKIFPSGAQWLDVYRRVFWYTAISAFMVFFFWRWHFRYTGGRELNASGLPRAFDSLALALWVFVLLLQARFAYYVHTLPEATNNLLIRVAYHLRAATNLYLISGGLILAIWNVWNGVDLQEVAWNGCAILLCSLLIFGVFSITIGILRLLAWRYPRQRYLCQRKIF